MLENTLQKAILACLEKKGWPSKIEFSIEFPKNNDFGNISTNVAMKLASVVKNNPIAIAEMIKSELPEQLAGTKLKDVISKIDIKQPGFINFWFSTTYLQSVIKEVLSKKLSYGQLKNRGKVHIEFVSANPTGPLTIAHGRQAAFGDSLSRILSHAGFKVTKEYLINDEGRQINLLGKSIKVRYLSLLGKNESLPEDGYQGEYIVDVAKKIYKKFGLKASEFSDRFFSCFGRDIILKDIKNDLKEFRVLYNGWISQENLVKKVGFKSILEDLEKKNLLYKKDGALWFKSTTYADDKDRVLIKATGSYTYFLPDILYHKRKFDKKYSFMINIWGPDHHGYIPRIKASIKALGFDDNRLNVLIAQLVTLYKEGNAISMSTRLGSFITLRELRSEVGIDAARFFYLTRRRDSHLDFDLDLAKKKSTDNPVYYIQYVHARCASVLDKCPKRIKYSITHANLSLLNLNEELELMAKIEQFPYLISATVQSLEPYRLVEYLIATASIFHGYYSKHRIISDDKNLTKARMALVQSVKTVIQIGLSLLGISTPNKM